MAAHEKVRREETVPFDGIKENRQRKPPVYFNILYYGLILWAILFCGYYLFSGWSSHGEFEKKMDTHLDRVSQGRPDGK